MTSPTPHDRSSTAARVPRAVRCRRLDRCLAVVLFLAVCSVAMVFGHNYRELSVYDEYVHFDYVNAVTRGQLLPAPGRPIAHEALKELGCRPSVTFPHPDCARPLTPREVPAHGVDYVSAYGPVYYWSAAALSLVIHPLTATSWLIAARWATALIFAAGAALLFLVSRRYGASTPAALGTVLALACCPLVLFQGSTVTPDSMALLSAAAVAWLGARGGTFWRRMAVALPIGVLIALSKPNSVPVGCLAVLLAGVMPADDDEDFSARRLLWRPRALLSVVLALVPLLVAGAWNLWTNSRLPPGVRADGGLNEMLVYHGPLARLLVRSLHVSIAPLDTPVVGNELLGTIAALVSAVLLGGSLLIAGSSRFDRVARVKTLSMAGLAGVALTALYVPIVLYVSYHADGMQPRYVIPAFAILAVPVAAQLTGRVTRWLPMLVGVIAWVAALSTAVGLH